MEKERKVTKKEMFGKLIEVVENAGVEDAVEMVAFLNHEIELVSKKRAGQTKTQKANEGLIEVIYEAIANADNPMTVTEIYEVVKSDEITSPQKVSALVKKLRDAGKVTRVEEGRKAYFKAND